MTAPKQDKTKPSISVVQRRLRSASPFRANSGAVPLKDPTMIARIANAGVSATRHFDMVHELGWVPVTAADLAVPPDQVGFTLNASGYVCRGAHGEEVVFMMKRTDADAITARKAEVNKKSMGSTAKVKQDLAQAAAAQYGSEAGDFVHNAVGDVTDTREVEQIS